MSEPSVPARVSHVTLALTMVLHAFTHAYGVLLVPLYLLMIHDLHLGWVKQASLIVTIYGLVYNLGSYPAGILADRLDRKWLLGLALIGNAIAIGAMGTTKNYPLLCALGVLAGIFGTIFHPSANSLIPAHYPKNPGTAIGILGIGSGLGFFIGPQYAGWRAQQATWHFGNVADWQRPCIEMGIIGVVFGIVYLVFAREARTHGGAIIQPADKATLPDRISTESLVFEYAAENNPANPTIDGRMRRQVLLLAAVLSLRDFAGVACVSLTSLYLQTAHGFDTQRAGFTVGAMMLLGVIANPLGAMATQGRRRLQGLAVVLVLGGLSIATVPLWKASLAVVPLAIFQSLQLGSYAISDAAMLERVPSAVRGRVVGLFLTVAGTFAALSPFAMGFWVDKLGVRAGEASAYFAPYATLGAMIILATGAVPVMARLGRKPRNVEVSGVLA